MVSETKVDIFISDAECLLQQTGTCAFVCVYVCFSVSSQTPIVLVSVMQIFSLP